MSAMKLTPDSDAFGVVSSTKAIGCSAFDRPRTANEWTESETVIESVASSATQMIERTRELCEVD